MLVATMSKFSPALKESYCARAGYSVAYPFEVIEVEQQPETVERTRVAPVAAITHDATLLPRRGLHTTTHDELKPTGT